MNQWLIFLIAVTWLVIIFIGAIAFAALRRADDVKGLDLREDFDAEIWRHLLFEHFVDWIERRAEETPWLYKFWDKTQAKLKKRILKK